MHMAENTQRCKDGHTVVSDACRRGQQVLLRPEESLAPSPSTRQPATLSEHLQVRGCSVLHALFLLSISSSSSSPFSDLHFEKLQTEVSFYASFCSLNLLFVIGSPSHTKVSLSKTMNGTLTHTHGCVAVMTTVCKLSFSEGSR